MLPELDNTKDVYAEKIKKEEQEKIAQITSSLAGPVGIIVIGIMMLFLWYVPAGLDVIENTYNYVAENGVVGAVDIFYNAVFGLVFWVGIIAVMLGVAWGMSVVLLYR